MFRHKVKEIAEVSSGLYLQAAAYGNVACLQARDFGEDGLLIDPPRNYTLTIRQEKNLLVEGDVLLSTKGTQNSAYLFPVSAHPAVAGTAFTVLRLRKWSGLMPGFLCWWLNSSEARRILRPWTQGTDIPSISKETVENLEVPIPPLDRQALILKIQTLADQELHSSTSIAEKRHLYVSHQLLASIKQ
jgi:hypothetical protein